MLGNTAQSMPRLAKHCVALPAIMLAGCMGGGDSGGGDADAMAACGRPEVRNMLVDEGGRDTLAVSLCFDAGEGRVDAGDHLRDVSFRNDRLTLTAREVDRPRKTEVTILDPDGNTQVRINIAIRNNSGEAIEARATHLVKEAESILELREDRRIHDYMLEVAYLEERITSSEKQALMAEWRPESRDSHQRLDKRLQETEDTLEAYQGGNASESELDAAADNAVSVLPNHGEYGATRLAETASEQDSPVPDTSHGTLTYRDTTRTVSRRFGNRNYGEFDGDEWQFSPTFTFLATVTEKETRS